MYLLYSCLVLLTGWVTINADKATLKDISFVNVIKQNLRRNNDDYVELTDKNNSSTTSSGALAVKDLPTFSSKIKTNIDTRNNIMSVVNSNRRAHGDQSWEFDYNELKTQPSIVDALKKKNNNINKVITDSKDSLRMRSNKKVAKFKFNHVKRNVSRLSNFNDDKLLSNDTSIPRAEQVPNFANAKEIDKFKKFMSKNKDLLKVLWSSKSESKQIPIQNHPTKRSELKDMLKNNALKNLIKTAERTRDEGERRLPDPELLDMAPAKGGHIHRLRVKGRLCQRHVLLPEGPKYDSGGRWYVPAQRLSAQHLFHVTPAPLLLLPRCCNCCKKSVLGCQ